MRDRGSNIIFADEPRFSAFKYQVAKISDALFPAYGNFEDWGYGGGWDFTEGGTTTECEPFTYPLSEDRIAYEPES